LLRADPHFALVYEDKVAAVFLAHDGARSTQQNMAELGGPASRDK
jgi:hypothetical protein